MIDRRWAGPLALGLAAVGLITLGLAIGTWMDRSPAWAYDFRAYWEAALRLVATGSPYTAETLAGPFRLAPPFRLGPDELYMYSPVLAMLFVPLTAIGEPAAVIVWLAVHVGALGLACALMPIPLRHRLTLFGVALLSAPVLRDLELGNVSLLVTLLGVVMWRWLDRPAAGIALAIALLVRPTMALIGAWWLVRGIWRPVAWAATVGIAVVLASLVWLRPDVWLQYPAVLGNVRDVMGVPNNLDLGSAVLLLGGSPPLAELALYAGYAVAIGAVLLSVRRDRELSYVVALMSTLILSPLLWDHYLINLLVPAAFLAARGRVWGLALPLLAWLPQPVLPLVAIAGMLVPFLAGPPASRPDRSPNAESHHVPTRSQAVTASG